MHFQIHMFHSAGKTEILAVHEFKLANMGLWSRTTEDGLGRKHTSTLVSNRTANAA